jgi:hypothetical protein
MPCCGKTTTRATANGALRITQYGVVELASMRDCDEPDCRGPYQGHRRNSVAYIVGIGTEHERLFTDHQGKMAAAYASRFGKGVVRNDKVLLSELPTRAVNELYGE